MELHSVKVKTARSKSLSGEDEVLIVPIGDIQYGSEASDVKRLRRHIAWAVEHPNAYFIGMGDFVDMASPSNRGRLQAMISTDEVYDIVEDSLEGQADRHVRELLDILAPTRGRWLGILGGDHYWMFPGGKTSDTRFAQGLNAPFLGTSAIINVQFPGGKNSPSFNIFAHHGVGSGRAASAPVSKLEKFMATWDAVDVFLMGHHHKKVAIKIPRTIPVFDRKSGGGVIKHRNLILAGTGGFLRGYMKGSSRNGRPQGGYVEQKMLPPVTLGGVVIYARPMNDHVDLDISV